MPNFVFAPFILFVSFFVEPVAERAPSGMTTEHMVLVSNVLIILATLWLTYATLKAAAKERSQVAKDSARNTRLLIRILGALVPTNSESKHRKD